jgi:flagellar export protein FliJ
MAHKFSLAAVLRVRGIIEEREESNLQKILSDINQVFQALERTDTLLADSENARYADVLKPSIGLQVQASYAEVKHLKQLRKNLVAQIQKLEEARDAQLLLYEAAKRNRQMLTDMRQKQRDVYNAELTKREQKTLDDNYIARRGRL